MIQFDEYFWNGLKPPTRSSLTKNGFGRHVEFCSQGKFREAIFNNANDRGFGGYFLSIWSSIAIDTYLEKNDSEMTHKEASI